MPAHGTPFFDHRSVTEYHRVEEMVLHVLPKALHGINLGILLADYLENRSELFAAGLHDFFVRFTWQTDERRKTG